MSQILRKSLTAWDACPADPPTPMMNSRPPRSRKAASPRATSSIRSVSIASITETDSPRNSLLKVTVLALLFCAADRKCVEAELVFEHAYVAGPEPGPYQQRPEVPRV